MELSYIKELWSKNVNTDRTQENNTWDSYVRDCVNDDSVNFENNSFLKFIQSKVELTSDMRTLDIGCGEGKYSLAIASKVKNVLGVDSSSEMIKKAKSLSPCGGFTLSVGNENSLWLFLFITGLLQPDNENISVKISSSEVIFFIFSP